MEFQTTSEWNEVLWRKAERVYHEAFPEHGRKNRSIIRGMFEKGLCQLHLAAVAQEVIGMALTGVGKDHRWLIVDYLAIGNDFRTKGYGRRFVDYIKCWAEAEADCIGIVIEVEAEPAEENLRRIRFWEQCGFRLTDYVQHYIWVPEPYRAMYLNLSEASEPVVNGETLFRYITGFHKEAYRRK